MATLLLAAAAFGAAVNAAALESTLTKPTDAALSQSAYQPGITTAPSRAVVEKALLKRSVDVETALVGPDNTCGYISGIMDSAYTCGFTTGYCAIMTIGRTGVVGCCNSEECDFSIDCFDRQQLSSGLCGSSCLADTLTVKCTNSAYPYCGTVRFFGTVSDYFCHTASNSIPMDALTTYNGEGNAHQYSQVVLTITDDGTSGSSKTAAKTNGPATNTVAAGTGGGSSGSSSTSTATASTTSSSSSNIGAIVGGAVGGTAVVAIIGFGAFFLMRRRNNNNNNNNNGNNDNGNGNNNTNNNFPPGNPPMQQQPGMMGAAAVGGGAAHQSVYNPAYGQPQQQQQMYGFPPEKTTMDTTSMYGQPPQQHQQVPAYPGSPVSAMTEPSRVSMLPPAPASPSAQLGASGPYQHPQLTGSSLSSGTVPGSAGGGGGMMYGGAGVPGVPPTVHEAGGDAVNAFHSHGSNANHHGQFHEMPS